jgi:hypothetical protein
MAATDPEGRPEEELAVCTPGRRHLLVREDLPNQPSSGLRCVEGYDDTITIYGSDAVSFWGTSIGKLRIVGAERVCLRGVTITNRIEFFDCGKIDWMGGHVGEPSKARVKIVIGRGCPEGNIRDLTGGFEYCRVNNEGKLVRTGKNKDHEWNDR